MLILISFYHKILKKGVIIFYQNMLSLSHLSNLRADVIFNYDVILNRFPRLSTIEIYVPHDVFLNSYVTAQTSTKQ
jgi:hypothetical protein